MTTLPLDGVTVVSLEQAVAAPFATRQLADLGARVIKVERPSGGDFARGYDEKVNGLASYFVWLNRSKESIALDLKVPAGRAVLEDLIVGADVFVQNLAPGAAVRLGLGNLNDRYPNLVVCNISGYGSDGPWADRKAYDLLVQCEVGLVSLTGTPDQVAKAGISIADIAAGMYAFSGILAALYQRNTTGRALDVNVSLFDSLSEWMGAPAYYTLYGGRQPDRIGAAHATISPYGPYVSADGKTVLIGVQNEREWVSFCEVFMNTMELASDKRFITNSARVQHRSALDALISERTGSLDAVALVELLDRAKVANANINSVGDYLEHPVLAERCRWREVGTPTGPIRALLPPAVPGGAEPRMGPVPDVGEHTLAILGELGRSKADIEVLSSNGAI